MITLQGLKCNLCGYDYYKVIYKIGDSNSLNLLGNEYKITADKNDFNSFRIVQCLRCDLIYVNPQDSQSEVYSRYRNMEDNLYAIEEKGRRISARILIKKISKYKRRGRILDIGCATGFLLDEAKKQGWEVYGVELSNWAINFAKEKFNLNIFEGVLADAKFPNNYFDVITMIDFIEHVPDPKQTLEEVKRILKLNGMLCISTPDIDSFLSRFLQAKWWGIKDSHLFYFSKKNLSKMLEITGFKVIKYTSHVRVFSIAYWGKRLNGYNIFLYNLFIFMFRSIFLRDKLFKLGLKDQIEVYAYKSAL